MSFVANVRVKGNWTYLSVPNANVVPLVRVCIDVERMKRAQDDFGSEIAIESFPVEMDGEVDVA